MHLNWSSETEHALTGIVICYTYWKCFEMKAYTTVVMKVLYCAVVMPGSGFLLV